MRRAAQHAGQLGQKKGTEAPYVFIMILRHKIMRELPDLRFRGCNHLVGVGQRSKLPKSGQSGVEESLSKPGSKAMHRRRVRASPGGLSPRRRQKHRGCNVQNQALVEFNLARWHGKKSANGFLGKQGMLIVERDKGQTINAKTAGANQLVAGRTKRRMGRPRRRI